MKTTGTVLDEILDIMESPKYGDVTNLETGHNINVRKRVIGNDPKKHTRYQVAAATDASAFDHPELVNGLHDLGKISPYRSADVLAGLLEGEARRDPFDEKVAAPEDKPAISGPVQQPGGMQFEKSAEDEEAQPEQGTPSAPDPAAKPQDLAAAREALKESIKPGSTGS